MIFPGHTAGCCSWCGLLHSRGSIMSPRTIALAPSLCGSASSATGCSISSAIGQTYCSIPEGPHLGLSLWNSVAGTMSVEIVMLAIGVYLYASSPRAKDRIGTYAFAAYHMSSCSCSSRSPIALVPRRTSRTSCGRRRLPKSFCWCGRGGSTAIACASQSVPS
jgi:hypothetical protein